MPIDVKSSDMGHDNSIHFGGRTATTLDFGRGLIFRMSIFANRPATNICHEYPCVLICQSLQCKAFPTN